MTTRNQIRHRRALAMIEPYRSEDPRAPSALQFFTDALADLRHLARSLNIDFDEAVRTSEDHYTAEIRGE